MTIALAQSLPTGNAIRLILIPPAGASRCIVLRKQSDTISSWCDSSAVVVYDGGVELSVLDWNGIVNSVPYVYRDFWFVAGLWEPGASTTLMSASVDTDVSVDVLSIVRERIDLGLQAEVARGTLNNKNGRISVLTAPPVYDNTAWPVVTVHVNSDASGERAIGETMGEDTFDTGGSSWLASEGWLSRWNIGISGWSLNPDERILLRKAIKRIVLGNLPVFDAAGMLQVELSQQDAEDFERYSAPVYLINGTLTCLAMSLDSSLEAVARDIVFTPTF